MDVLLLVKDMIGNYKEIMGVGVGEIFYYGLFLLRGWRYTSPK